MRSLAALFAIIICAGFSTVQARQFAESGRNLAAPEELSFLDQFVGTWEVRPIQGAPTMPPIGRMQAYYILDGTMLQADYRGLNPQGQVAWAGTSLRTWDPVAGVYTMKWAMSFDKGFTIIEAHDKDGELVSTGWGEDRQGAFKERYRFFEIATDSFKFEMERSYDDGQNWSRMAYNRYTRVQE